MTDHNLDRDNSGDWRNNDDLDWLAFCYIADELEPVARDEFEARLENDAFAQQAVVDAMEQAQVLYSSLNPTSFNDGREPVALADVRVPPRVTLRRSRVLIASAAALLMLVAGWAWLSNPNSNEVFADSDSEQLASAWLATLVVMSDDELDEFIEEEMPIAELNDEHSHDWMLVALTDLENSEGVEREDSENEAPDVYSLIELGDSEGAKRETN